MIDNIDFNKIKNNSYKLIGTLALSGIIAFNVTGCVNINEYLNPKENQKQEETIQRAPCPIRFILPNIEYTHKTVPDFTIFIKDIETKKWKPYATYLGDNKDPFVGLVEGEYLLYSKDIGEYEFNVDDINQEYSITADYVNKTFSFETKNISYNEAEGSHKSK